MKLCPPPPEPVVESFASLASLAARVVERAKHQIPTQEPYRSRWCRLHTLHLAALKGMGLGVGTEPMTRAEADCAVAACGLADAKYRVWLDSVSAAQAGELLKGAGQ